MHKLSGPKARRTKRKKKDNLLGLFAQKGNEVISVLALLQATKSHLGARNVFLGILEVFKLGGQESVSLSSCRPAADLRKKRSETASNEKKERRTRVSSAQVMPLDLFDSEYEKPSTWPVLRPKRPCRLGPILLPSPSFRLWHCAQRVCKDMC